MAIFKYKKPDGNGGYTYEEMPVISNTYTEYVVQEITSGSGTIELTPSHTSETIGDVTASIKFLTTNPTITPSTTAQTINFASEYGNSGFPSEITISAITAGSVPSDLQITTPSETITIPAGYYSSDVVISSNITNKGNIKDQTQITPSNYNSTYYNTGYYTGGSTNGKINIKTSSYTLTSNTTYNTSYFTNGFPTSITVSVPSSLPEASSPPDNLIITTQNGTKTINAGYYTSDIVITASLPTSTVPSDITISSPSDTVTIPAGYLSNAITINSDITNRGAPGTQSLKPQTKTSYTVSKGYYSSGFTVSPSTQTLTSTNPTLTYNSSTGYYEKTYTSSTSTSSTTVWGDNYLTQLTLKFTNKSPSSNQVLTPNNSSYTIPTGYHATSGKTVSVSTGSKSITSNDTYYASNDGYYYSSVNVQVPTVLASGNSSSNNIGTSGSNISWRLYTDGTLVVDGYGSIKSFTTNTNTPWSSYQSTIKKIHVGGNILSIGQFAFAGLSKVEEITLGPVIHTIEDMAFYSAGKDYSYGLDICIPPSVKTIGAGAFGDVDTYISSIRITATSTSNFNSVAFYGTINRFYVSWDSSIRSITSMVYGTVSNTYYNHEIQNDNW